MKRKKYQGFILIEILVSLLVFSVGVLFLVQTISSIVQSNQHIRDNYSAMLLINNLLNRLYAKEIILPQGVKTIQGKDFNWDINYQITLEGLKQIFFKVRWQSKAIEYSAVMEHQIIYLK